MAAKIASALLAMLALGAGPAPTVAPPLNPALALAAYEAAITNMRKPPNVIFDYVETRSGPTRVITEIHRVYRNAAGDERNDTIAVNGSKVVPPISHIYLKRAWPYDADQFAALPADYDLAPGGRHIVAGKSVYAYAAKRKSPAEFSIENLFLTVDTGLPVRETFTANGASCSGRGAVDFAAFAGYWLPVGVSVTCTASPQSASAATPEATAAASSPATFRETLKFENYVFPAAMPPEIFRA